MVEMSVDVSKFSDAFREFPKEIEKALRFSIKKSGQLLVKESRKIYTKNFTKHTGKGFDSIQVDE